jgi:ribonuclease J
VQPKDAYLLRGMYLAAPGAVPDVMQNTHVCLYADPKARPAGWEQHVRARYAHRTITPAQAQKNPGDYILAFSLSDIADLLDLEYLQKRAPGGVYIFANSPAYDDEQKVDLARLWHWTQRLGLTLIGLRPVAGPRGDVARVESEPGYHASGHAGGDELEDFVKAVRPQTLIPIHTSIPERWKKLLEGIDIRVVLPEYGKPIAIHREA